MKEVFDKKSTLIKRRILRKKQTKEEEILWNILRGRKINGIKYKRQHGIGEYIVDFYSHQLKLVIELDGKQHLNEDNSEYDRVRTNYFNSLGIEVIRFKNSEILEDINLVIKKIKSYIIPSPLEGEGAQRADEGKSDENIKN
jgi:very-short-patch-repair endonuclease